MAMKEYLEPSVEVYLLDGEVDMLSGSVGTDNDNNYEDIENWFGD